MSFWIVAGCPHARVCVVNLIRWIPDITAVAREIALSDKALKVKVQHEAASINVSGSDCVGVSGVGEDNRAEVLRCYCEGLG